jgi:hypothetical protein
VNKCSWFLLLHFHALEICYLFQEEFVDTKGVIKIRKSNKNSQHNDKKKYTVDQ